MDVSVADFGEFLDDPEHADSLLHLHHSTDCSAAPERSYHCHAILLSQQSTYFKARLSSAWQNGNHANGATTARSTKIMYELHEHVEDLAAMDLLLQIMYRNAHSLPEPMPSPELLFHCLHLADRLGAVHCMDLLLSSLACITTGAMDYEALVLAASIPPGTGVWSRPACQPLMDACKSAVVRIFRNVPAVISDEAAKQRFCAMPFAAVLAWAGSEELEVHSENCVVFLLSCWVAAQRQAHGQHGQQEAGAEAAAAAHEEPSAEQLEQLAHQVRVFHLGPAYQHQILPNLPWFKGCSSMEHLPTLLTYKRHGLKLSQVLPDAKHRTDGNWRGAEQWVAKPRRSCSMSIENTTGTPDLCWRLTSSDLQLLSEGTLAVYSPVNAYLNGFLLRVFIRANRLEDPGSEERPSYTLGMFCGVDAPAMATLHLPWPSNATVMAGGYTLAVVGPDAATQEQHSVAADGFLMGSSGWGFPDFLLKSAPTMQELLSPYLRVGLSVGCHLQVEGRFTRVDAA